MSESNVVDMTGAIVPLAITSGARRPSWWQRRRGTQVDVEPLVAAMPSIGQALATGNVVRIVGPSNLLDGIRNGTFRYLEGAKGHFGTVIGKDGHIVGQVQFHEPTAMMHTASALAAFQLASAVTLQYYLQRIDAHLEEITTLVKRHRRDAALAVIERAAAQVGRFAIEVQSGPLSDAARRRLDDEERAVDLVARQERRPVDDVIAAIGALVAEVDELSLAEPRNRIRGTAESLRESVPGGLRSRTKQIIGDTVAVADHWQIVCAAAYVHAALVSIQVVDDDMWGRATAPASSIDRAGLAVRAEELAAMSRGIAALCAMRPVIEQRIFGDLTLKPSFERLAAVSGKVAAMTDETSHRLSQTAELRPNVLTLASSRNGQVRAIATT
jgi:hypothetical protein